MSTRKYGVWGIVAGVFIGLSLINMPSCSGLAGVINPLTGDEAASPEAIAAAAVREERKAAAERADAEAMNATRLREAQIEAQRRALEIQTQATAAGLDASRALADLELTTQAKVTQINMDDAASAKRYQETLSRIEQDVMAAQAAIETRRAQTKGILDFITNNPIVAPVLASAGIQPGQVSGGADTLLFGGAGALALYLQSRRRKDADTAWDESEERAEAKAKALIAATDKAWDDAKSEAKNDALMAALVAAVSNKNTPAQ